MRPTDLESITIEDFRSIKGRITIPLDAPIVLIHGVNGAGKSSVLSALELGLTGATTGLGTGLAQASHLVHRGAERAAISLRYKADEAMATSELVIRATGEFEGEPALAEADRRLFAERCYLAQSRVSRLLEIYQQSAGGDSALTRFVKEILGLDRLEALIDGLHDAGDIRRTRHLVPELREAEFTKDRVEKTYLTLEGRVANASADLEEAKAELGRAVRELVPGWKPSSSKHEIDELLSFDMPSDDGLGTTAEWIGYQQELAGIRARSEAVPSEERAAIAELERAAAETTSAVDGWRQSAGVAVQEFVARMRTQFPDLPGDESGPGRVLEIVANTLAREIDRIDRKLNLDVQASAEIAAASEELGKAKERSSRLQEALLNDPERLIGLGRVLTELLPHVEGDTCPVCDRDFAEVGHGRLGDHVTGKISTLGAEANRLLQLASSLREAQADEARITAKMSALQSQLLASDERLTTRRSLSQMHADGAEAARLLSQSREIDALLASQREARTALLDSRNAAVRSTEVRHALDELAAALNQGPAADEPFEIRLARLTDLVRERLEAQSRERELRGRLLTLRNQLSERFAAHVSALDEFLTISAEKDTAEQAMGAFESRLALARQLVAQSERARSKVVQQVFNHSLNDVWRDLFVRLVPSEPFVPAFRVDRTDAGRVSANLETRHRDGGLGGNPTYMLSSGNLNTGAVTLFLALNLSANPDLPWLILDDPVQSMDEVHIAQFAALLRTLAKQAGKRLVLAVHERSLFDYLCLELSPAFPSDKLITVELSRADDGDTQIDPRFVSYEDDLVLEAG